MRKERGAILKLKCSPSYMFGNSKYNSASVINTRGGRRDAFRLWDGVPRARPPQRRSSAPQSVPVAEAPDARNRPVGRSGRRRTTLIESAAPGDDSWLSSCGLKQIY